MTKTSTPAGPISYFYTDPGSGLGIPCTVLDSEDGMYHIELITGGETILTTAGGLYCEDESGRYLGGPQI